MQRPPCTVVYILGAGHCGSTLLSLLLNGHSRMLALSEVRKIHKFIRDTERPDGPNPLDDVLWQKVRHRYEWMYETEFDELHLEHPSWKAFSGWSRERLQAWVDPYVQLLRTIVRESGCDILVDSSKSWQQLYLLQRSGRVRIKVVHALRDGRAVLHSYNRKYHDFRVSFGQWVKPTAMAAVLRPLFASRDWHEVRYEALSTAPEETLTQLCQFLDTEFEPEMLRFRSHPWFGIGGNRMAHDTSEEIRLDEKWRRDLSRRDRLLFGLLGGALNRYYGYRPFSLARAGREPAPDAQPSP